MWVTRLLRVAAYNFDLVRLHCVLIVQLEVDVFDKKRPDIITEAISIKMALQSHVDQLSILHAM